MNEIFEKIYNNNTSLNEDTALFEKVYMEVKMLNEMNPKLKALLAAGLIGTAGLGAVSCSMPTDDPYDAQYTIEQPTPENPEEIEEIEDSEEIGDNGGEETRSEFDTLCADLFDSEHLDESKEIIRKLKTAVYSDTVNFGNTYEEVGKIFIYYPNIGFVEHSLTIEDGFMYVIEDNSSDTGLTGYIIPNSYKEKFDSAISHAE